MAEALHARSSRLAVALVMAPLGAEAVDLKEILSE
jgi:hypothetical protein